MRKILFAILGVVLMISSSLAQSYFQKDSLSTSPFPKLAIKFLPTHAIGRFGAVTFAVEHLVKPKMSLEYRYGFIHGGNSAFTSSEDDIYFANKAGFKSSAMIRFATSNINFERPYIGVEVFHNNYSYDRTKTFEISCGPGCSYYEERTYGMNQIETGLRVNYGMIFYTDRFLIELSAGLGFMYQDISTNEQLPMDVISVWPEDYIDNSSGFQLAGDLALKVGYIIFK